MSRMDIYEELRQHAGGTRGLGIPDEETHQARLALAGRYLSDHKAQCLLDVGCGYGDLRLHALRCDYLGIDAHDWMINEARARQPTTAFRVSTLEAFEPDPVRYDTVAALGVLSTVERDDLDQFLRLLRRQAHRYMLISFLPDNIGYAGRFCSHAARAVIGQQRLLSFGQSFDEITVMLEIVH